MMGIARFCCFFDAHAALTKLGRDVCVCMLLFCLVAV